MRSIQMKLAGLMERATLKRAERFPGIRPFMVRRLMAIARSHEDALLCLASAGKRDRDRLLHLLTCRRCRRQVESKLSQRLSDDFASARIEAARRGDAARRPEGLTELSELALRVASRPEDERFQAIEAIRAERGLAALELAESLIAAAVCSVEDDPARAGPLAELAVELIDGQAALPFEALAVRLGALSLVVLLRHRLGDLEAAEAAYQRALPLLTAATKPSRQRAMLLAVAAQLRWTQARFDEAAALFPYAAALYAHAGEPQAAAACRLLGGFVLLAMRHHDRARLELEQGSLDLDSAVAPALAARAAHGVAHCYAAAGKPALAISQLEIAHKLYGPAPETGEAAQRAWQEGHTLAYIEQLHDEADGHFDAARRSLLAHGSLAEAARCTLDLLRFRVHVGGVDDLAGLGAELIGAFRSSPDVVRFAERLESLSALAIKDSPRFEAEFKAIWRSVADLPTVAGRPAFIPSVQVMADRLLVTPEQDLLEDIQPDDESEDTAQGQVR
jgi:tetratricopeptide (TPR) repeat protein